MENTQIAAIFDEIADLLEIQGDEEFRIRSYRNAARTVRDMSERIADLVGRDEDLSKLPHIGTGTAEKIHEILDRGTCKRLEDLRKKVPRGLTELIKVPGLGPEKTKLVYQELGVESLDDLKEAAEDKRLRDLEGMGAKTEEKILRGLQTLEKESGRISLKEADDFARAIGDVLDEMESVKAWHIAGSFRRRKETIGDLDVIVRASKPRKVADRLEQQELVADTIRKGKDILSVRLGNGLQIDYRFFDKGEVGSALMYFTGSKAHNIAIRKRAQDKKWKLNEYGLFSGRKRLAGDTEKAVYKRLGMAWVPPELREDRGEVDAAVKDDLPTLVERSDVTGDLHAHTTATDGTGTIEEMYKAAKKRGHKYLAITDHSKAVRVAGGLDEDGLKEHADAVRKFADSVKGFWVLAGIEVDVLKSGKLDLDEDVLAGLDWVVASVHSHFALSKKKMTERLLSAVRSGVVDCIGHPLGRMIGHREPIELDLDPVLEACAEHDVCLEINANPERLDLPDIYCQRAKEAGVKMVISTDAHKESDLDFLDFGVAVARRGWLEKKDIFNTVTLSTLRKRLG